MASMAYSTWKSLPSGARPPGSTHATYSASSVNRRTIDAACAHSAMRSVHAAISMRAHAGHRRRRGEDRLRLSSRASVLLVCTDRPSGENVFTPRSYSERVRNMTADGVEGWRSNGGRRRREGCGGDENLASRTRTRTRRARRRNRPNSIDHCITRMTNRKASQRGGSVEEDTAYPLTGWTRDLDHRLGSIARAPWFR
jgi:hypothetical protein